MTLDWFAPALDVPIGAGLDKVLRSEESRLQFVRALKQALANPIPHAPDRISLIQGDIKALDKALRLRVGILPLDRREAWFRSSPNGERSPIASTAMDEPIFMRFDEAQAAQIRLEIPELWRKKLTGTSVFDPGPSIWGRLLTLNKKLAQLGQLPGPFHDIHLEDLPDAIPDEFASPALAQFGTQLAQRYKLCVRDLDTAYQTLWTRSESFLYAQHVNFKAGRAGASSSSKAGSSSHAGARRPAPLTPMEEALKFMNFSRLPAFDDLRQRYRAMAQVLHPDRGGNEDKFKLLTLHYQAILKQIQRF